MTACYPKDYWFGLNTGEKMWVILSKMSFLISAIKEARAMKTVVSVVALAASIGAVVLTSGSSTHAVVVEVSAISAKPIQSRLRIYVKRGDDQPWELVWVGNPLQYPWNDKGHRVGHDFPPPLLGPTLPGGPAP